MPPNLPIAEEEPEEEIAALVRRLHETQQRLQELAGGEVDAVQMPGGQSYLLHEAQEKLRQSESAQRHLAEMQMAILNALPAHIALLGPQGVILSVNEAWRRFATANVIQGSGFGVGQNYLEVCTLAQGDCSEEAEDAARGIRRVLRGEAEAFTLEYPCHSPADERWFRLMVTPLQEGRLFGAVVMHVNITERKVAEEALRESEARMQTVINNMTEGLVICGLDGRLIHSNRAVSEMHGFPDPQEWRQTLAEFDQIFEIERLDGEILTLDEWPIGRVFRGENLRHFQVRVRRRATDWERTFSYNGDLVREPGGRQIAFLTISDITERKQAEEEVRRLNAELEQRVIERTAQLEAANKELEAFSYSVSHDLRAPLRTVDGFSQAVLEDYGPLLPVEGQLHLQTIRNGAQRMGNLIDDLLTFSRLSRAALERRPVDTAQLVREVLADLSAEQEGRKVEIRVGDLGKCLGDRALLKQVWINLLSNALKYTRKREQAVIVIACHCGEAECVFSVQDNGAGFDMKYASKLFGVFQRLHRAEDYAGTGVGLAIVQRIVHRHGGRIWAEAEPECGATFSFTLETDPNP